MSIDIQQAAKNVGRKVIYTPPHARDHDWPGEEGVITSVGERYIFVRYGSQTHSAATRPEDLDWMSNG